MVSVNMLSVTMLSVTMLSVTMLNVIMLSVVMLNVVAPIKLGCLQPQLFENYSDIWVKAKACQSVHVLFTDLRLG